MPSATEIRRSARQAGLLYLAMSIVAMIGYFYVHRLFFVSGDPAATARNILANERLYRISILIDLVVQLLFILVVLALYRLFKEVDPNQTRVMVALVGTGIAAQFAGFVLNAAPLMLLGGADYLSVFSRPQLEALSYASLNLAGKQGRISRARRHGPQAGYAALLRRVHRRVVAGLRWRETAHGGRVASERKCRASMRGLGAPPRG